MQDEEEQEGDWQKMVPNGEWKVMRIIHDWRAGGEGKDGGSRE